MQKVNYPQLELFSKTEGYSETKKIERLNNSFFGYIRIYERITLILIGSAIMSIVSFSLGVERGKKLALTAKSESITGPKVESVPAPESQEIIQPPIHKDAPVNYTIQVASYENKASAEREAETLRKNGLLSLILAKGKYTVVCVGNFSNRETAKALLSELKKQKRYRDCLIRKL